MHPTIEQYKKERDHWQSKGYSSASVIALNHEELSTLRFITIPYTGSVGMTERTIGDDE